MGSQASPSSSASRWRTLQRRPQSGSSIPASKSHTSRLRGPRATSIEPPGGTEVSPIGWMRAKQHSAVVFVIDSRLGVQAKHSIAFETVSARGQKRLHSSKVFVLPKLNDTLSDR